ncbi:MAG: 4-(cytidine 5'-diphospho)-2-C-methyl-D-erythritol kinase [Firmicutes bacterium]|nr:4-(cytidine 5'-diphospho)-2-C-methyl-D-erythritol kinase [Bacillota bacterium]
MRLIRVPCPAKINLTLKVLGKRADGYHELETVMQSVSLLDVLHISDTPGTLEVGCTHPLVPVGEENLVYKAAKMMRERYAPAAGASIQIEKNIPLAAGLAGGSSDAAGTIRGLNHLWGLNLTPQEMEETASLVGSDVTFCLRGGTALARGRGELISPLPRLTGLWLVLVKPPLEVSTGAVYQAYRPGDSENRRDTRRMLEAVASNNLNMIAENLFNDLELVTRAWYPEIEAIKQELREYGARGVLMSGSGPTVFGVVDGPERARSLAELFRDRYPESYAVYGLPPLEAGEI